MRILMINVPHPAISSRASREHLPPLDGEETRHGGELTSAPLSHPVSLPIALILAAS